MPAGAGFALRNRVVTPGQAAGLSPEPMNTALENETAVLPFLTRVVFMVPGSSLSRSPE